MDELTTDHLLELIERKLHLLSVIKQMSVQQTELIRCDEVESLLALLARKNEAMDGLQRVQKQLAPFQSQNADSRIWKSESDRRQCREMVQQCEQLLADLISLENMAVRTLSDERAVIGDQLRMMQSAHSIHKAYEQNSAAADDESTSCFSFEG